MSRGSRPGLLAADQQPLAPDRKRHPVLCGSAEPSWPLGGGGERPAAVSLGQDDGQLGQRGQSLALCQRGQEPGDEGIPAPVVSSGVTFALPTPAARHPDGPPHRPRVTSTSAGPERVASPAARSSSPLSSCSSSMESLTTSARAMAALTCGSISAGLPHTSGLRLGSKQTRPPAALMAAMACRQLVRTGSLASAMEQVSSHCPASKWGKSAGSRNWSALGRTMKVKLRSLPHRAPPARSRCYGPDPESGDRYRPLGRQGLGHKAVEGIGADPR